MLCHYASRLHYITLHYSQTTYRDSPKISPGILYGNWGICKDNLGTSYKPMSFYLVSWASFTITEHNLHISVYVIFVVEEFMIEF